MRVRVLKQTRWKHAPAWSGSELDLPDDVAAMWIARGIARKIATQVAEDDDGKPDRRRSRKAAVTEE